MLSIRPLLKPLFVATACAALVATPTAVLWTSAPSNPSVLAEPHGSGGPDGNGGGSGCGQDTNWQGCGGYIPGQGAFGHGCVNGICGSWDSNRGWFSG